MTFSRSLRYRNQTVTLPDGSSTTILVGQEKGIDVRLFLDIVRLARENAYDVALIFSQDQDLSEVADEVRKISMQGRRINVGTGVESTGRKWVPIDRKAYDACLDPNDYRPKAM